MKLDRKQLFVLVGLLVSVLFLWLAFRGLHPDQFFSAVQQVNVPLLLVGMAVYGIAVSIISLRWQFLLRSVKQVPLSQLIPLVTIGYMGNNIYPFRSGEMLRIFLLRRNHDVPYARGATTVIVERVFDGIVMLTFLIVPLTFLGVVSENLRRVAVFTAPIFIVALIVFFVLAARPNILRRLAGWFAGLLPERLATLVTGLSEDVIGGLEGLRTPADLIGTIISSYATWAVEASVYWIVTFAFGLDISYPVMLLMVGVINLAGLLPTTPGQVGVFEFFAREVLTAVGIDSTTAAAYAIVVHIVIWLPPTLAGLFFLTRQGLGLREITHANELQQRSVVS